MTIVLIIKEILEDTMMQEIVSFNSNSSSETCLSHLYHPGFTSSMTDETLDSGEGNLS